MALNPGEKVFVEIAKARASPTEQQWFKGTVVETKSDGRVIVMAVVGWDCGGLGLL